MTEYKKDVFSDEKIDLEKREFLKKLVHGTAYSVPVILSFSMSRFKPKFPRAMAY